MSSLIQSSVGSNAVNFPADALVIQELLNMIAPSMGGPAPALEIDGIVGPETIAAISQFQTRQLGFSDGRVDPNGQTLQKLNMLSSISPPASLPTPVQQAENDKPQSALWLSAGLVAFQNAYWWSQNGPPAIGTPYWSLVNLALATHFKFLEVSTPGDNLARMYDNACKVTGVLARSYLVFQNSDPAQAAADRALDKWGNPYPAYTFYQRKICFSNTFLNIHGPLCRAAMVLHEPFHYVDIEATSANEVYEHSPEYDYAMTPYQALHNPSSYVSFCQHVYYWQDRRYGAANINQ